MTAAPGSWPGSPRSRVLAGALGGLALLGFVALVLVDVRQQGASALVTDAAAGLLLVWCFVALGTVLSLRQPGNAIGWLLTAGGLTWLVNGLAESIARQGLGEHHVTSATRLAATLGDNIRTLGILCSVGLPLLLFPSGRPRSRRWRMVMLAMIGGCTLHLVSAAVSSRPIVSLDVEPPVTFQNPFGIASISVAAEIGRGVGYVLLMSTTLAAVVGIVVRFRSASGVERQQLRWIRGGAVLALSGIALGVVAHNVPGVPTALDASIVLGLGCLPITFTVAVLRFRLYDLDRIVSRTVTYAALTGLLVASYAGLVTGVSRLTPSSSSLAVASSTLAVAAIFQPLRRWLQRSVDQRFNRARYDADRTVDAFRLRLREEVDLDAVRAELLAVAQQTLQPAAAALWLRDSTAGAPAA